MVQNIFDLINSKAENTSMWRQLSYAREKRRIESFEEAISMINEFIHAHRLNITDEVRNPFNKNVYSPKDYTS